MKRHNDRPSATRRTTKFLLGVFCAGVVLVLAVAGGVWAYAGIYGLHVVFRHGGTWWVPVAADSPLLSPAMRLAIGAAPVATPGRFAWRTLREGFDVADLPATIGDQTIDHILLARIDPVRFRFVVYNSSSGDSDLDEWMSRTGAVLVVNGSYYARDGRPDTPVRSEGVPLGPPSYDARAGAFVASPDFVGIRDLDHADWQAALQTAANAMVSYPLLVAGGAAHLEHAGRWVANRSFVGQDGRGRIVIGTTTDAFFTLDRFAHFLSDAPLGLTLALNLDGGPVASQGIALNGYERRTYGRWEAQVDGDRVKLLTWPYGTVAMPIVLAVFPK